MARYVCAFLFCLYGIGTTAQPASPDINREASEFWQEIDSLQKSAPMEQAPWLIIPVDSSASPSALLAKLQGNSAFFWSFVDSLYAIPNLEDVTGLSFEYVGLALHNNLRLLRQRLDQLEVNVLFDEVRRNPDDPIIRAALDSAKVRLRQSALLYYLD